MRQQIYKGVKPIDPQEGDVYIESDVLYQDDKKVWIYTDDKWKDTSLLELLKVAKADDIRELKYTGREFECVALEETEVHFWSNSFKVGQVYKELTIKNPNAKTLSLEASGLPFTVDADCFELT